MKKYAIALGTTLMLAVPTIGQADANTADVQVKVQKLNSLNIESILSDIQNGTFSLDKNLSQEQINNLLKQALQGANGHTQMTPAPEQKPAPEAPKQEAPKAEAPAPAPAPEKVEAPAPAQPKEEVKEEAPAPKQEAQSSEDKQFAAQVLDLVNQERQKAGLQPVQLDEQVASVATKKSEDMRDNNYFSHTSPTYGSPFDMLKQFGVNYNSAGENIAAGQRTPEEVMKAWMESPGHKANILSSNFTHLGVGVAKGGSYGVYWTQMFIGK
ncbi:CAP domain-containing protein [Mangrovibacillus cuniculi]|uniref:Sporulation protein n=1 Tax=Mangrovibacillus cuniculi TaxID=2593652 RepID=A0A7S8CCQ2_9BACI|nr:CAP domain-containing protein [Mangrovibacillus cuniculi]QPC47426.1 sporulation protein [Mangrovibacillus cuniculi]